MSSAPGYGGSLESFLFGSVLGISTADVITVAIAGAALLLVIVALHKEFLTVGLDRETARAAGLPLFWLDMALYAMVTIAIVISIQAVGNILVLALLVTPAACARLLTDRIVAMMLIAPAIGALSGLIGLYLSYAFNLAAGGLIVLTATGVFVTCWLFAPRHGLLPNDSGTAYTPHRPRKLHSYQQATRSSSCPPEPGGVPMRQSVRRLLPLVGTVVMSTVALAGVTPLASAISDSIEITHGYVDAIDVDWTGTTLTLDIRDATVIPAVDRNPADVILTALPASRTTVSSNPAFAFLGNPGDPVWILPETQDPELLWPAFNVGDVPIGVLRGDTVNVKLVSVNGPGDVSVFTFTPFGAPVIWFDSGNGLPDTKAHDIRAFRTHQNWAFEAPGTYSLTFEVTATKANGQAISTGQKTYTFSVQP